MSNKLESELTNSANNKINELVDHFQTKNLQLESKYKLQLINDIKQAKDAFMKEINEHLKIVDTFSLKSDLAINLKRINNQCKLFKQNVDSKLESISKLKDLLKIDSILKKNFESNVDDNELNVINESINKISLKTNLDDVKDVNNLNELNRVFKEAIGDLIDSFEAKGNEAIDNTKSSLNKHTIDFQNEINLLKYELDGQESIESKSIQDEQNGKKLKDAIKNELDKELKKIIENLNQTDQNKQIKAFNKQLAIAKKAYLNKLKKSDCLLINQYLDNIKFFQKKLWSKFNLIFSDLITNLDNSSEESSKQYKSDPSILKSLNDCIEKTIRNYDSYLAKTIDQAQETIIKKLKEIDNQFMRDLQLNERRMNKKLIDKFIQSIDLNKRNCNLK